MNKKTLIPEHSILRNDIKIWLITFTYFVPYYKLIDEAVFTS